MTFSPSSLPARACAAARTFLCSATGIGAGITAVAVLAAFVVPATPASAATRDDLVWSFTAAGYDHGHDLTLNLYDQAARDFGVDAGLRVDGGDIDAIVAAAWASSVERFATAGIGIGDAPDVTDFTDAAARFGIDYGSHLSGEDAERILAAGRAAVGRSLHAAGIGYGSTLDTGDLRRAADGLGVPVGARLDPEDTRRIVDAAWTRVSSPLMATARGVRLYSPSPRAAFHGWHQASGGTSVAMDARVGRKLPSRGRGTAGTSAVDVAMDAGDPVRAPVSGRVVEVRPYALYGKYSDYRLRIVPDDNPGMLVSVLHVEGPRVRVGQHVQGGVDVIASSSRKFPFYSQIDGLGGGGRGHVHVEMRPR